MEDSQSDYYDSPIPEWADDHRDGGRKATEQDEGSEIPVMQVQQTQPYYHSTDSNGCGDYAVLTDYQAQAIREFVGLYYRTLTAAPQDAWRHYTVTAQYAHADGQLNAGGHGVWPVVGQQQVHAAIVYQQYTECRFRVASVLAQRTPAGDYVALVAGTMSRARRPPNPFVQTFVLCHVAATDQWAICNAMLLTNYE